MSSGENTHHLVTTWARVRRVESINRNIPISTSAGLGRGRRQVGEQGMGQGWGHASCLGYRVVVVGELFVYNGGCRFQLRYINVALLSHASPLAPFSHHPRPRPPPLDPNILSSRHTPCPASPTPSPIVVCRIKRRNPGIKESPKVLNCIPA